MMYFKIKLKYCSHVMLKHTGLRFGSIGLICLMFMFLPVSRGSILLRLTNIPFEHATRYHVWLGHLTMTLFTLHGSCYFISWILENRVLHQVSSSSFYIKSKRNTNTHMLKLKMWFLLCYVGN